VDLVWKVLCANRLGNKASELQMVMEKLKLSSWDSQDLTICIERTEPIKRGLYFYKVALKKEQYKIYCFPPDSRCCERARVLDGEVMGSFWVCGKKTRGVEGDKA
jgi:hypothetical protein